MFHFFEQHKTSVEYICNCSSKANFGQKIFMFNLIKDLFLCFIMQNGRLFFRNINKEVVFKIFKLFNNSQKLEPKTPWFNMCQRFSSWQAKLSLNIFIIFKRGSKQLKPYIQTNDKFRELFTKHSKTLLGSIVPYIKVAYRYIYQIFTFSFWWVLFILFIPSNLINFWTITFKGLQWW